MTQVQKKLPFFRALWILELRTRDCIVFKEGDQETQSASLLCILVEAKYAHRYNLEKFVLTLPYFLFISCFGHFFSPPMTSEPRV